MGPRVVAFGGGHGLAASLRALRTVTDQLTAVVGVSDNGGSSGRLRSEFDLVPPGDLRMALTALCADSDWGQSWAQTLQHRFPGDGPLGGHALGNLLITSLWQQSEDLVAGLARVSSLLGSVGRVLPLSLTPLDIVATVDFAGVEQTVRGQVEVATTNGRVVDLSLEPSSATATPQALTAVAEADVLVFGPGSWFTSVLTSFALPDMRAAIAGSAARRLLIANLCSQQGETEEFSPAEHLETLAGFAPELRIDACFVDSELVDSELGEAVHGLGATLVSASLASQHDPHKHDSEALGAEIRRYLSAQLGEHL